MEAGGEDREDQAAAIAGQEFLQYNKSDGGKKWRTQYLFFTLRFNPDAQEQTLETTEPGTRDDGAGPAMNKAVPAIDAFGSVRKTPAGLDMSDADPQKYNSSSVCKTLIRPGSDMLDADHHIYNLADSVHKTTRVGLDMPDLDNFAGGNTPGKQPHVSGLSRGSSNSRKVSLWPLGDWPVAKKLRKYKSRNLSHINMNHVYHF